MKQPPLQRNLEERLSDIFKRGDITSVASWEGKDHSWISTQIDPDRPEVKSIVFRFNHFLDSCFKTRPELGSQILLISKELEAQYTPQSAGGEVDKLRCKAHDMLMDLAKRLWATQASDGQTLPLEISDTIKVLRDLESAELRESESRYVGLRNQGQETSN